jgi:hypothetical protein
MKVCTKCKVEKELTEFNKGNDPKTGLQYRCKECLKKYRKENKNIISEKQKNYRIENKDKISKSQKEYRFKNADKIKEVKKLYLLKNPEISKEGKKKYYYSNIDKIKEYGCSYRKKNNEIIKQKQKEYYLNNKEKILCRTKSYALENRDKINKNQAKRKSSDPLFKLKCNIYNLIYISVKKQGYSKKSRTYEILGCTFEEFKIHLEKQFTEGMSWGNMGKWHLDHIHPVSLAKDEEEIIKLNHYTNFQPLWAIDNIRKSNKI